MRLKEAFRYQNSLTAFINLVKDALHANNPWGNQHILFDIKEHHLKSKANKDMQDETLENPKRTESDPAANTLINLYYDLCVEKLALTTAIGKAKQTYEKFDYDSALEQNVLRGKMISTLQKICELKGSKSTNSGIDYMINQEGNQVQYCYPIEVEASIDFDRNRAKAMLAKITAERDVVSDDIEEAKLLINVEFNPKYDVNATFDDLIANATVA